MHKYIIVFIAQMQYLKLAVKTDTIELTICIVKTNFILPLRFAW